MSEHCIHLIILQITSLEIVRGILHKMELPKDPQFSFHSNVNKLNHDYTMGMKVIRIQNEIL